MPIPAQRDLESSRAAFRDWLATKLADASDVEVSALSVPSGSGFSNETLLADVTWRETTAAGAADRSDSLVIRVKPTGFQVFLDADFAQQYRLLSVLDSDTPVPVPPMLWFEDDSSVLGAPFFVMRRVRGAAPTDQPPYNEAGWLYEATTAEREVLWRNAVDALITVHRVPLETVSFLAKPELGDTGFDQLFAYWQQSFAWAAQDRAQPVAQAAWDWMAANLPAHRPTALSWGDSRVGNILFDNGRVSAVVDWEMLSLGGHMVDVGWWLFLDDYHALDAPRLPGLGSREETIALWEAGTGEQVEDLAWYEVFAGFRFAVVMMRLLQMLEAWGVVVPTDDHNESNNPVTRLLAHKLQVAKRG